MLKSLFNKCVNLLRTKAFGWKTPYEVDIQDALSYLDKIKEPKDDIARSYAQYRCQRYLMSKASLFLYNLGCMFLIIPYVIKCCLNRIKDKGNADVVFTISIKDKKIIPESLRTKYDSERITGVYEGFKLNKYDLSFILKLWKRHPFSFFFVHRIVFKIAIYRYFIERYHPKAIVINSEYSSTSSIMTLYCEEQGVEHINIMHGEKLLYIRDSFFRFTKCYVWDEYYISLFKRLRAVGDQFVVETPPSLHFDVAHLSGSTPCCDYKYMLFENEKLEGISKSIKCLKSKGLIVKVRPHPSYTDMGKLKALFDDEDIEDVNVPIASSVSNSGKVISLVSTVLLQAYFSGIEIVIDDVNYGQEYAKLKDLGYILINKPHLRMSELLN